MEEWQDVLRTLASAADPWLFVTRLPLVRDAASFVTVQRPYRYGYDTEYIGWTWNRAEFLDGARACGAALEREFLVEEPCTVEGAPEQPHHAGFLFRVSR